MQRLAILNTHPIQYFAPLYRRLAREPDIDLTVYFCSKQGAEEYVDVGFGERIKWDRSLLEGYQHKFLNNWRTGDQVGGFWSLINPGIVSELRKGRYDALIVNGHNHATYLFAMLAAKTIGTPVMMRCETHLSLPRSSMKRAIRTPVMNLLYNRLCSACLPIGTRNREFYLYHGVNNERLFTTPYAVDNDYFTSAVERAGDPVKIRSELGLPLDKPLVLFLAKILTGKRPMDLLTAFQRLRAGGVDGALVFVGSGDHEQALKDRVAEQGISNVHFFGFRNQSELPNFYSVADVFVFPSERESWGLVLNEAMCAGLPVVVCSEIGAVRDLVRHGENGFVFELGNIEQLAEYLSQLLKSSELRIRMGLQSRKIINEWDLESCVGGIRQALAHVAPLPVRLTESRAL